MSCVSTTPLFRLLDRYVGWDDADATGLSGLDKDALRLALHAADSVAPGPLWPLITPPWIAPGCNPAQWFLMTPHELRRKDVCDDGFRIVRRGFRLATAVAVRRHRVAVSDYGANLVLLFSGDGAVNTIRFSASDPGPLAFLSTGELAVAIQDGTLIRTYSYSGEIVRDLLVEPEHTVVAVTPGRECDLFAVTEPQPGVFHIWHAEAEDRILDRSDWATLEAALDLTQSKDDAVPENVPSVPTAVKSGCRGSAASSQTVSPVVERAAWRSRLVRVAKNGFCLLERDKDDEPAVRCYDRTGDMIDASSLTFEEVPRYVTQGQLLTKPIDSGIPRCRWHRVRIDAEVPPNCDLRVEVATGESDTPDVLGKVDEASSWRRFKPGAPHPDDWQVAPAGAMDFLVDQPAGRYLFIRVRFRGNGDATPVLRQIRLDFPRSTSLDSLPAVYREDPVAADFQERFLSLFDASVEKMDCAIEHYAGLIDPSRVPEEVLPWIAAFLDIVFDASWTAAQRRALLLAAPSLFRERGTKAGLERTVEVILGVKPVIEELPLQRAFGILGKNSHLRTTRLFSRAGTRFYLGSSTLDGTKLRTHGDPDLDPLTAHAFRFRVMTPPLSGGSSLLVERLMQLVGSLKPAHTIAKVRTGGMSGFTVGQESIVGIDTVFKSLRAPVLGKAGNVRLGHASVLWPGGHGKGTGFAVGQSAAIGVNTLMK